MLLLLSLLLNDNDIFDIGLVAVWLDMEKGGRAMMQCAEYVYGSAFSALGGPFG